MSFFEGLVVTYQLTKTWGSHNYCFAVETITFLTNDICRWLRHQKNRSPQRNGQRSTQMSYFPLCQLADFAPFTMAYQNPYGSGFFCIPCKNSTEGVSLITASTTVAKTLEMFGTYQMVPSWRPLFSDVVRVRPESSSNSNNDNHNNNNHNHNNLNDNLSHEWTPYS